VAKRYQVYFSFILLGSHQKKNIHKIYKQEGIMLYECCQKAVVQGASASAVSAYMWGTDASAVLTPFNGATMPLWQLTFLLSAGASLLSDGVHSAVDPDSSPKAKLMDNGSIVIGGLVAGVAYTYRLDLLNPEMLNDYGVKTALAVGVGSELLGAGVLSVLHQNNMLM
jgi:hypothetical protein